jgi:nucleoside-diphosphate-sugar epimerase
MVDINYRGTVNVLNAAERLGNVRVVHMGSCEEYGDCAVPFQESQREQPLSPYALSKVAATYACLYYHRIGRVSAVVLRPTVIYGPGETRRSLFSSVVESCLQGQAPRTSPGQQTRDFVYVDDVVDACLRAAVLKEAAGRIINIGSGCESTVEHVVRMICESTGTDLSPEIGSLPYREHEIMRYVASVRVAKDVLGWTVSKSLEDGIGCLLDEMRRVIGLTESKDAGT